MAKCKREQESDGKRWRESVTFPLRERVGYFNKFNNYFYQELKY